MLGCAILPGNVQDRDGCRGVLTAVRRLFPFLERVIADGAYQGQETARAVRRAARARLEIVKRSDAAKGFVVLPKRWSVLPCTILPGSASSGQPWSLASI
jgi:transposase